MSDKSGGERGAFSRLRQDIGRMQQAGNSREGLRNLFTQPAENNQGQEVRAQSRNGDTSQRRTIDHSGTPTDNTQQSGERNAVRSIRAERTEGAASIQQQEQIKTWSSQKIETAWHQRGDKLTAGEQQAKAQGLPPAEPGYHWRASKDNTPDYISNRNSSNPERYFNTKTQLFENKPGITELARTQGINLNGLPSDYYVRRVAGTSDQFQVVRKEKVDSVTGQTREQRGIADKKIVKVNTDIVEATFGPKEVLKFADINSTYTNAMQQRFDDRATHVKTRDELKEKVRELKAKSSDTSTDTEQQNIITKARELGQSYKAVVDQSRIIGEIAGEAYMNTRYSETHTVEKMYQKANVTRGEQTSSQTGDFDQVWRIKPREGADTTVARSGDKLIVIEAKGGGSQLETAIVDGRVVRQGSKPYFNHIVSLMVSSKNDEVARVGKEIRKAARLGNVEYRLVEGTFATREGKQVLGDIHSRPFKLDNATVS